MNAKTIELLLTTLNADPSNLQIRLHIAELMTADQQHDRAAQLLQDIPVPAEEEEALQLAQVLKQGNPDQALQILDGVIAQNKACAPAYRQKADLYRLRGLQEEARKNYNVAAVIDESLEDDEFQSWLDQAPTKTPPSSPEPTLPPATTERILNQPLGNTSSQPSTPDQSIGGANDGADSISPDEFIETDPLLDQLMGNLPTIDFNDIGGMEALKERIRMSIIYPFKNKALFEKFKKRTGGGLLIYGPPGCGKTLISRATAGECGAHFINISVHEVLSKWIGESEQRLHQIFETARRKAPTIIFIDEVDALGVKRSDAGHTASMVNTLLTEIDGASSRNEDILVIGATNTPWRVDSAFRRPGRFDHVLFVSPPDSEAREAIFKLCLNDIPQEKINLSKLAKASEKFSGADIRACVEAASEVVIQEIMRSGKEGIVREKDLLVAIKKHRPTTLEWLEQASNYASYANQAGLYDELADYIESL